MVKGARHRSNGRRFESHFIGVILTGLGDRITSTRVEI